MNHKVSNPFLCVDDIITSYPRDSYDAVIVDFHRETTAELYGMWHYLMWRVALVYGTHTHIQTNDARILGEGTAIITDVGMNGPYNSVIGADFSSVKKRFLSGIQKGKIEQSLENTFIINAVILELDPQTWKAQRIENISYYGTL